GTDELGLVVLGGSSVVGYPAARPWTTTISSTNGGPNTTFNDGTSNDMVHQISFIQGASATSTAEALSLAYIELQKAHMRDLAGGTDGKLNAIVFFTDGAPTSGTFYLNDNDTPDNVIKSSAGCTNGNPTAPVAST